MIDYVSMAISTKCNNSCIWCYGKAAQKLDIDMSNQTFDCALSLLKQAGCKRLTFLGGEPTLHSNLTDFIHKAADNSIDSVIVSNGSGYSDTFLNSIEDVKDMVTLNISIEGATADIHDRVTNKQGSFEKLLYGIKTAQSKGFDIAAIMTLCKSNMQDLANVICLLEDIKVDGMLINFANRPLNANYSDDEYLSIAEYSKQVAIAVSAAHSLNISVGPPLPLCCLSPLFREMLNTGKIHHNSGCQLLFGRAITIDAEGNILLCNHLTEVKTGNINKIRSIEELQSFLENVAAQTRKSIQKYPLNKCNKCKENVNCFGGCPLLWLK
jgi:radical SAM protein with 4Fe4S-binding SPASM domain